MILMTKHFGELDVEEANIFKFEEGILGFPGDLRYIVVRNPEPEIPFDWLQAIDHPELAFVITDPFFFKDDYEFDIPEAVQEKLDVWNPSDVLIYAITVITDDFRFSTMNLRAPLVLNTRAKVGCQLVLDNEAYSVKHRLFPQYDKGEV